MERPDLDALEREYVTPNDDAGEDVKELVAYARRLEANQSDLRRIIEGCDKRIAELEAALEPFARPALRRPQPGSTAFDEAARVLNRKGT